MYESSGGEENGAESLLVESMNESDAPDQQPSLLIKTKPTADQNQLKQDPPMLIAQANHSSSQPLQAKNPNEILAKASQTRASNMPINTRILKHAKNPNLVLAQMSMGDIAHAHGYGNDKHLS